MPWLAGVMVPAAPEGKPRMSNPIVLIPARMGSTRLPGKPLADIHGEPMIVHVWRRAMEAAVGPVAVACAEPEIAEAVTAAGGRAVLTDPDHASGTDRIFEALEILDPNGIHKVVINMQGDLPTLDPEVVQTIATLLEPAGAEISTLAAEIGDLAEAGDPSVVKAVVSLGDDGRTGRALYFSRAAVPTGDGPLLHHIGIYGFTRVALARFVATPPTALEKRERLEQLRALETGMRIDVALVDTVPLGVDTPAQLEEARAILAP